MVMPSSAAQARRRIVGDVRSVADPRTPSVVAASRTASAGPASAAWAVSPRPGRGGDRVRLAVRRERREDQLVAGHVETDDAPTGGGGRGPRDREIRLRVEVAQEADHQSARQARRLATIVEALARRRDDRGEVEPRAGMRRRPEADLEEVATVGGASSTASRATRRSASGAPRTG